MTSPPGRLRRFACAALLGIATAAYADWFWHHPRTEPSDFVQPWAAARMLAHGQNPYNLIGPGRPFEHQFLLIYPATAALAAMPFAWRPLDWPTRCSSGWVRAFWRGRSPGARWRIHSYGSSHRLP